MKETKYSDFTVGSDYARDLYVAYLQNVNRELTLTKQKNALRARN